MPLKMEIITLEVPYNGVFEWLAARRKLDGHAPIVRLSGMIQQAVVTNVSDVASVISAAGCRGSDDVHGLLVESLWEPLLERCRASGRADTTLFGKYKDHALSKMYDLVQAARGPLAAAAIAHTGQKLADVIDRRLPTCKAEIETAVRRRALLKQQLSTLESKLKRADDSLAAECARLGVNTTVNRDEVEIALRKQADDESALLRPIATALLHPKFHACVTFYTGFVDFVQSDPLHIISKELDITVDKEADTPEVSKFRQAMRDLRSAPACIPFLVDITKTAPAVDALVSSLQDMTQRDQLVCELHELQCFIAQRALIAAANNEPAALLDGATPFLKLICNDCDQLVKMVETVTEVIRQLQSEKLIHVLRLREDSAFVASLVEAFVLKQQQISRLRDQLRATEILYAAADEAVETFRKTEKELMAFMTKMKLDVQRAISALFGGLPSIVTGVPS